MKRAWNVLLVSALLLALCAAPLAATAAVEEPVELSLWVWTGSDEVWARHVADTWTAEHPNYTIEIEAFEHEAYKELIMNSMAAGQAGDICELLAGPKYANTLADGNRIMNLDELYAKYDWENVLQGGNTIQKYNGSYYFITSNWISVPWVYYDADVFEKLGLSEPETEEALYQVVATLKENGYGGIALGTMVANYADHFISGFLPRYLPVAEYQKMLSCYQKDYDGVRWTDPRVVECFKTFKKWVDDEIFVKGMNSMDDAQARSLFISGKAAMYQGGSWVPGLLAVEAPEKKIGAFLYPQMKEDIPITADAIMCNGFVINANAKYPEACGEFMNYMLSHEMQDYSLREFGIFPTRRDFSAEDLNKTVSGALLEVITSPNAYETTDSLQIWLTPDVMEPYLRELQEIISDQSSVEDSLAAIEALAEQSRAAK